MLAMRSITKPVIADGEPSTLRVNAPLMTDHRHAMLQAQAQQDRAIARLRVEVRAGSLGRVDEYFASRDVILVEPHSDNPRLAPKISA